VSNSVLTLNGGFKKEVIIKIIMFVSFIIVFVHPSVAVALVAHLITRLLSEMFCLFLF